MNLSKPIEDIIASSEIGCPVTEAAVSILTAVADELNNNNDETIFRAALPAWVGESRLNKANRCVAEYVKSTRASVKTANGAAYVKIDPLVIGWATGYTRKVSRIALMRYYACHILSAYLTKSKKYKIIVEFIDELLKGAQILLEEANHFSRTDASSFVTVRIIQHAAKMASSENLVAIPNWPTATNAISYAEAFGALSRKYIPYSIAVTRLGFGVATCMTNGKIAVVFPSFSEKPSLLVRNLSKNSILFYLDLTRKKEATTFAVA